METRKETLNALKLCRFCLTEDDTLTTLYDRRRAPKNSVPLPLKILSCVSIEVYASDRMPSYICSRCKFFMDMSYEFKQICRQADENVLEFVQTGTDLCSVPWPQSLQKLYRAATKSAPEMPIMKTIVEGGATIQVTAQDYDSEEGDDENVYNVKIRDGSDEGEKSTRVKVITADSQTQEKVKPSKDSEDEDSPNQSAVDTNEQSQSAELWDQETNKAVCPSQLRDGCWACDECDCTYPLQQLLDLHKKVKHRQRNVQCNQCDAKFYNNNDLVVHQLRHSSEELIFQCVACDKKFKRHILLKRHEKLMHADLAQLPCQSCPATFLSQEELEVHQEKHASAKEKRFACDVCDKRFYEKSTLQRHKTNVHDKEETLACVYCPERFSSVSKLTRHVRSHAGDRAYPCKHCDKSFVKSHHYTRHLRVKHRDMNRTVRGPFGETTDSYRCEQCEDSFTTQDELIYHSAIHATQNLICPLCQEKFEDVDAVTAHIKSHVNGTEFMCDLCELVFTTKDKLDNHVLYAHIDEIQSEELDQEESANEMEVDDDDDYTGINVKEEDDHMVVEIKKPDGFMLPVLKDEVEEKNDNINSEESESEMYAEIPTEDTVSITNKETVKVTPEKTSTESPRGAVITKIVSIPPKTTSNLDNQGIAIIKKVAEGKREPELIAEKKNNKVESNNTGANDKSLRLLEKELQELKRTNTRTDVGKTTTKPVDTTRNKRIQIHTSTPKTRTLAVEEKKVVVSTKSPSLEKQKQPEKRIVTKENKEPKEIKETKGNNSSVKEDKDKEVKGKETPKIVTSQVKNNGSDKTTPEEGIRRSTRPSKIKDYAKMIRDRTQDTDEEEDSDEAEEEYKETEKNVENKLKARKASVKPSPKPSLPPKPVPAAPVVPSPTPRKRGRPRKDFLSQPTPPKVKKEDSDTIEEEKLEVNKKQSVDKIKQDITPADQDNTTNNESSEKKTRTEGDGAPGVLVSPTGQTLKKIPVQALPPGLLPPGKGLPLPNNARLIGAGKPCKMQLGTKLVNVQKIVVTKAEVEAMTKKGLLQMKDGTMVLKQGVKLPTSDSKFIQAGDDALKESPKKPKGAPTRCDIDED